MKDQFITSKILRTDTFSISGYILPRKILSKDGNDLNLSKIRKTYLEESKDNPNVDIFLRFMKEEYPGEIYIQELPVPMRNFFLNYRCFDFFLPRYGVGIELDSHYHDGTENNDTRSDLYVYQNYGVNVLRIRLASETHKEKDLDKLRKFFHTHKPLETNFPLDFSEIIASEFRTKYEKEIKELESMENQFSCGIYSGNLIITKEQEKLLKPVLRILDISYNIWI